MDYPGTIIRLGATGDAVKAIQARLGVQLTGLYGPTTQECVSAFQAAHGIGQTAEVGPQTWAALFAPDPPSSGLHQKTVEIATSCIGTLESPIGSNRGALVDQWNSRAGVPVGSFWCLSFAWCMVDDAAKKMGIPNPLFRTASCSLLYQWARTSGRLVPSPQPGDIGLAIGGERGHYHAVIAVSAADADGKFSTIEGNSNDDGSSNGYEVAHRVPGRRLSSCHYVRP